MAKKAAKRIYTYEKLDALLARKGTMQDKGAGYEVTVFGRLLAFTGDEAISLRLRYSGEFGVWYHAVAHVYRVADGATYYTVPGWKGRNAPQVRADYRRYVQRFTPRSISGRTPKHIACFRVYDDGRTEAVEGVSDPPLDRWLLRPTVTRPSYAEWHDPSTKGVTRWKTMYPKLCRRAVAFYTRLRRELACGLPCGVQLCNPLERLWHHEPDSLYLHVVTAPRRNHPSRRLVIGVRNHDVASRKHFHIDGDYAVKHALVTARETRSQSPLMWKSTRDAIVGVKEWVMGTVYIPGL